MREQPEGSGPLEFDVSHRDAPVFVISVAAELSGMHPQTLRGYDRIGLVRPGRTGGGGRRYSWHDIEQLREVARLTAQGIGLEGVRRILELQNEVEDLRDRVAYLQATLDVAQSRLLDRRLPAVAPARSAAVVRWRRPTR
ncbi:MAG TPA: MerR family transcriptional regulator [Nocardioidaceae bacterium]|nr:MerR family transcriptional regulator [Nocardioidaceae bacterium]